MTLSDKSCTSPTLRCCAATAPPTTSPHARRPASAGFCGLSVIHTSSAAGPAPTASPAPRPRNIPARPSPRRRKTKTKGRVSRPGPSSCSFCWALPPRGVPLGALQVPLVVGEHGVEKVHVGVHGLLRERLRGLALPLLMLDELARGLAVALRLSAETTDDAVEERLRHLGVELLRGNAALRNRLVRIPQRRRELLRRLVDLLLLLGVQNHPASTCCLP